MLLLSFSDSKSWASNALVSSDVWIMPFGCLGFSGAETVSWLVDSRVSFHLVPASQLLTPFLSIG